MKSRTAILVLTVALAVSTAPAAQMATQKWVTNYVGKAVAASVPSSVENGMGRVLADGRTARPAYFGNWAVVSCTLPYRDGVAEIGLKEQPEYFAANGRWSAKFVNMADPSGLAIGTAGWTPPFAEWMFALRERVTNIVFEVRDASDHNRSYSVEVARPVTAWAWDEIALSSQIPYVPGPDGITIVEDEDGRLGVAAGAFASEGDMAATTQRVAQVESNVSSMWYTLYGESCWLAVTNYMRSVEGVMPSFSLWEVRDDATNEVYSSRDEVTNRVAAALAPVMDDVADAAAAAESAKAWGRFQSADGTPAPAKFTMVTTPYLMMTGGGEWEQHVVSGGGEYWVFTGAGGVGGTEDGNFRLLDSNGATAMEVTAGSVQTVGAVPASFSVSDGGGGTKSVSFAVFATSAPTLYAAESPAGPWSEQAATWTAGAAGTYSCAFSVPSAYDRMFFKAAYEAGSAPCVKFAKPLEVTQLKIGGTVYDVSTKTDSDGSILLKLTVPTSTGGN